MYAWRDYEHAARIELRLRGWDKDEPQPCAEAEEFALMGELAARLGMDWTEADALLDDNATGYDAEADDAKAAASTLSDDLLLAALGRMIARRRDDLAKKVRP